MYCINKTNNIAWQDDGICDFLGILEAKLYYAVATSDLNMHNCVKDQLRFLTREFICTRVMCAMMTRYGVRAYV